LNYEELLKEANDSYMIVKELPLQSGDGRIKGKRIAIRQNIPTLNQKGCVLAEELGHYHTTVGNILDQTNTSNRKQERTARLWAYNKLIGFAGIIRGYQARCQNRHELAEYLDVTEEFLQEAIDCYREKYGMYVNVDNYVIIFDPSLSVIEKI
jgi:Zn-dependent peptidase ImmA (M78 family)